MSAVTVSSTADAVRGRWLRSTRRERVLLTVLAAAALAALPFAAWTWVDGAKAQLAVDASRLDALRGADDASRLQGATRRLDALDAKVREWSPPAPSFPVARVLVEQEAAVAAAQGGMTGLEVASTETPERIGPATFVRVELSGAFSWPRLAELTRRLAALRPGYVLERAAVEGSGPEARLRLVLLAPFRPPERA